MEVAPVNIDLNSDDSETEELPSGKYKSRKRVRSKKEHQDVFVPENSSFNSINRFDSSSSHFQGIGDINGDVSEYGSLIRTCAPNTQEDGTLFSDIPTSYLSENPSEIGSIYPGCSQQEVTNLPEREESHSSLTSNTDLQDPAIIMYTEGHDDNSCSSSLMAVPDNTPVNGLSSTNFTFSEPDNSATYSPQVIPYSDIDQTNTPNMFPPEIIHMEIEPTDNPGIFPSVHISEAGILSVLLKPELLVEMTLDHTIRIVDHGSKTVVAVNERGDMSCLIHAAARLFNELEAAEADIFQNRRVRLCSSGISFADMNVMLDDGSKACLYLHPDGNLLDTPYDFKDLSHDTSLILLSSSSMYGPDTIPQLDNIAQEATYNFHHDGGVTVFINNVIIVHKSNDDVFVKHRKNTMHVSQLYHTAHVDTDFCELAVEKNWNVKMNMNDLKAVVGQNQMILSDGVWDCGINEQGDTFIVPSYYEKHTIIFDGHSVDYTEPFEIEEPPRPWVNRPMILPERTQLKFPYTRRRGRAHIIPPRFRKLRENRDDDCYEITQHIGDAETCVKDSTCDSKLDKELDTKQKVPGGDGDI